MYVDLLCVDMYILYCIQEATAAQPALSLTVHLQAYVQVGKQYT